MRPGPARRGRRGAGGSVSCWSPGRRKGTVFQGMSLCAGGGWGHGRRLRSLVHGGGGRLHVGADSLLLDWLALVRRLLLGSLDGVGGLALHLRELRVQRGDLLLEPCGLLLGGGLGGLGGGEVGLRPGEVRLAHGEVRGGLLAATSQQRGEDGGDGEFHGSPTKSRVFDCTGLSTTTGQKRNAPGAPIFKPPWATRRRAPTRADKRGGSRPACALV